MGVLLLDGGDFIEHVAIDHCQSDIILAVSDVVLKIHGVGVGLDENVVLAHCFVHLLSLATVDHQNNQVSC